jgi:galactose mutarotase-like enzyme
MQRGLQAMSAGFGGDADATQPAVTLSCGAARALVLPARGAVLSSLALEGPDGSAQETLWTPPGFPPAGSGFPGGGAPWLFPFAGRVFCDGQPFRYRLGGIVRDMPLHGFAYACPWRVTARSATSVTTVLEASEPSRAVYPFDFRFEVTLTLARSELAVELLVRHVRPHTPASPRMPVALGWHPYFAAPAGSRLATSARAEVRVTPQGGAGKSAPLAAGLTRDLAEPHWGNLILADHGETSATLLLPEAGRAVRVSWRHAPEMRYVVLWTREGEPFHCIEPWMGLPDAVTSGVGVRWLDVGEEMRLGLSVAATTV